jgi:hypothetical protein
VASDADIQEVRVNTQESREDRFSDPDIGALVDSVGVYGASAEIWRKKAGEYTELVNVTEAGASNSFGDLQRKALEMSDRYEALASGTGVLDIGGRAKVKVIDRE